MIQEVKFVKEKAFDIRSMNADQNLSCAVTLLSSHLFKQSVNENLCEYNIFICVQEFTCPFCAIVSYLLQRRSKLQFVLTPGSWVKTEQVWITT